jgi:hypothetical protein
VHLVLPGVASPADAPATRGIPFLLKSLFKLSWDKLVIGPAVIGPRFTYAKPGCPGRRSLIGALYRSEDNGVFANNLI